jgi:hypothetical protein
MKTRHLRCGLMLAIVVTAAGTLHAQFPDTVNAASPGTLGKILRLSGEIGTYGELYSINGRDGRRPSAIGRLFFRPTLTLFDALSVDFDVLLSTEGNQARQDINQFGINPSWSWGQAHLGDFSDNYAQYTLNGIRVRGGGFFINPGLFRLGAVGGVTKRAVLGTEENGAYERYLYGGRIGLGSAEGGFFDLVFLRVRDKISSLATPPQTTVVDTANPASSTVLPYEVTPQENLIVGMMSHLNFFGRHVTWDVEASGSVFTRDMRVDQNKQLNLPDWVNNLYHANVTSSAGLAVRTELGVHSGNATLRTGYRYVSPGYTSLGVGSMINDWQEFSLAPSFRFGRWIVALNAVRQNDNLLGQKLNTLVRYQFGGNVSFQPTDRWSGTILSNYLTMSNDAANDTIRVSYSSLTVGTNQFLAFGEDALIQSVMLSYIYQESGNTSRIRPDLKFSSHSANAGITIPLGGNFALSPGVGLVVSVIAQQSAQTMQSYTLSIQHRAFENSLVSVLSGVMSGGPTSTSYRSMFNSTYRLTGSASIGMTLSMMNYSSTSSYGGTFNEYAASLNVTQRF